MALLTIYRCWHAGSNAWEIVTGQLVLEPALLPWSRLYTWPRHHSGTRLKSGSRYYLVATWSRCMPWNLTSLTGTRHWSGILEVLVEWLDLGVLVTLHFPDWWVRFVCRPCLSELSGAISVRGLALASAAIAVSTDASPTVTVWCSGWQSRPIPIDASLDHLSPAKSEN